MSAKTICSWLFKVVVAGGIAIVILSFVGFFYNYTGVHITNESGATDYTWESKQYITSMKEGYAWFQMDENGFNNVIVKDEVDILLMGSSHMEAMQMAPEENTGYLLNSLLEDIYTYNIGISGHTIYRIVDNIDSALEQYKPAGYVIIETSTIELDMDVMQAVIENKAQPISSQDEGVIYYLQKIPAFKPIYNQVTVWIEKDIVKSTIEEPSSSSSEEDYKSILKKFLSKVSQSADEANVIPIIFYAPAEKVGENGMPEYAGDENYLRIYQSTCEELGIVFIDMTDSFKELYAAENTLAHGFVNSGVGVGHLNKYGHQAIAKTLADTIREMEEK